MNLNFRSIMHRFQHNDKIMKITNILEVNNLRAIARAIVPLVET